MRTAALLLALCLGAFVPAHATPAARSDVPYKKVYLQTPDAEAIPDIRSIVPEPLLQVPATGVNESHSGGAGRIVYGQNAAQGQFPHQVGLIAQGPNGQSFCGGSVLAPTCWILTAKHCVPDGVQWIRIYAGSTQWSSAPYQAYASVIYSASNVDIALIKLSSTLPVNSLVKPVDPEPQGCGDGTLDNELGNVSGWGRTGDSSSGVTNDLQWVQTQVVSNDYCRSVYGGIIVDSLICTISPVGLPGVLCSGDSGGPLLWSRTGRQIGINSFVSAGGCESGPPSGYVRVPCLYSFIQSVIADGGSCP